MSALKLKRHASVTVDVSIAVEELTERFTDEQLATVGLFRSLRDADIAREKLLTEQAWRDAIQCEDDNCNCVLHEARPSPSALMAGRGRAAKPQHGTVPETEFWHDIRTLLLRRDFNGLARAIEERAWDAGGVSLQLPIREG